MSSNRLRLNTHQLLFIWLRTCRQLATPDMIVLTSTFPHLHFGGPRPWHHLGPEAHLCSSHSLAPSFLVLSTPSCSSDSHCHCHHHLCQHCTVSRAPTCASTAILAHSFCNSGLDYCSTYIVLCRLLGQSLGIIPTQFS